MGLFDSFVTALTTDGGIEKALANTIDKVEQTVSAVVDKGEALAENSEKIASTLSGAADKTEQTLDKINNKVQ
jgi:methyl-accepting chemotaxis protein